MMNGDAFWRKGNIDQIPNEIEILNLSIKSNIIESYKLSRYIFPKHDQGPTKAGLEIVSPVRSLEYAVNLCLHRVPSDLKVVWDEMAGRDSSHPEISRIGMQSTKYDLRQRSDLYRRQKDKREYVENLRLVKKGKSGTNSEQNRKL